MAVLPMDVEADDKKWRRPWWCCFGECSGVDLLSCCTAYWMPCMAWSLTSSKVFRVPFWREAFKFILIFGVIGFLSLCFTFAGIDCPSDQWPGPAPGGNDLLDTPGTITTPSATTNTPTTTNPHKGLTYCQGIRAGLQILNVCGIIAAVVWAVFVGGKRRTQMRQALGIEGTGAGGDCCSCGTSGAAKGARSDCCLHYWCMFCAIAQEMRTVLHLEAEGRLPRPVDLPPDGYMPLVQPPGPGVKMSREEV